MSQLVPRGDNSLGFPLGAAGRHRREVDELAAQTHLAQLHSEGEALRVDTRRACARQLAERITDDVRSLHRKITYEAADDPALAMSLAEVQRAYVSGSTALLRDYLSGRW